MPYNFDGTNELYGVFNEERGVFVGDPYNKKSSELPRYKGKQFSTPSGSNSAPAPYVTDRYIDKYKIQAMMEKRGNGQPVSSKAFIPSGGTKDPNGSGTMYGLFGDPKSLVDTDASLGARSGKSNTTAADRKKNIYVSPAKKGTFGFPVQDRTIGGTRFDFIPDEYCRGRTLEKELKKEARAKILKPFISTGRAGRGITAMPVGHVSGPDIRPRSQSADTTNRKPWKNNNPAQKGRGYGTLASLEYIPDPYKDPYKRLESPKSPGSPSPHSKAFKPPSGNHNRLSMWSPNPYQYEARPPPDNDFSLLS